MIRSGTRALIVLILAGVITLLYVKLNIRVHSSKTRAELNPSLVAPSDSRSPRPEISPSLVHNQSVHQAAPTPPIRRNGRYVGSTGQHKFYTHRFLNSSFDSQIVQQFCRPTTFTHCSPPAKRPEEQKQAARTAEKPYRVTVYRPFAPNPKNPEFSGCNYDNCVYTGSDVTPDSDAVYIYGINLFESVPFPAGRLPHQVFIYSIFESPINLFGTNYLGPKSKWLNYFNVTMTYSRKSEIFKPYGRLGFQPKRETDRPDYRAIARNKSRSVVWMVSNCETQSNRMEYVRELQKYISVDIFGGCGEKCEVNDERCVPDISATYRFYLAFENSLCTDYVTEKFFKLFIDDMHLVPVVRGAFDYNGEFPEKSLVNAANFKGPRELAEFLLSLEADELEYSKYLEIKDTYRAFVDHNRWCPVCEYLHKLDEKPEESRRKVVDLRQELYDGQCSNPPPIV